MLKILHLSDIHLGSGFSHGKINPDTGRNSRFDDFVHTLSLCIDRAIAEPVDLVLFGGDAFPDATPAPYIQSAFANQFYRLVEAKIPTVLLVGNHDQHAHGQGGASLCIYRTLGVPGFVVGDRLATHRILTRNGPIQVITLPWLTRASLLATKQTEKLSLSEVNHLLLDRLGAILEAEIRRLDPKMPTVLLGHLMVDNARYGAERFLAVGKGFTVPLSFLARESFDYVALGHVHKHQILCQDPPVVYPGSIERVDFSEEKEKKGFMLVQLAKGRAQLEFCPLSVRDLKTINVNLSTAADPQAALVKAIQKKNITDAVVRLSYQVRSDQIDLIDNQALHECLSAAHSYSIQPEVVTKLSRSRLPELGVGSGIDPIEALKTYLDNREDLKDITPEMIALAEELLAGDLQKSSPEPQPTQLSLL